MTPEGNIPIQVKTSTYGRLVLHKQKGETFDNVISRIIEEWEKIGAT